MKAILFKKEEKEILEIIEGVDNVVATDTGIKWNNGELRDIKVDVSVVADDFDLSDTDLLPILDPSQHKSPETEREDRLNSMQQMINYLLLKG